MLCPFKVIEKHLPRRGVIIDVGCGYGLLTNLIALNSNERDVYGYDLSERRINIANKSINKRKNIHFQVKHVKDLKLGFCDAIIMSDFLHHIPYNEQESLINQAHDKLKKDGIMVIQDIGKKPAWKYIFASTLDKLLNGFPELYYSSIENFKNMLEKNGFEVRVVNADMGLPLPDVLFVCRKTPVYKYDEHKFDGS